MSDDVVIPETFRGVHPLIRESRAAYRRGRTPDDGVLEPRRADGLVWLRVSPGALDRALLVLEALIRHARAAGVDVVEPAERRGSRQATGLLIGTEEHYVEVRLREVMDKRPLTDEESTAWDKKHGRRYWAPKKPAHMPVPTGLFVIELPPSYDGQRARFTEGRIAIEKRIAQAVESLLTRVASDTRRAQERARQARARQVANEQTQIKERYEAREAAREAVLIAQAEQWHAAEMVRRYLTALERAAATASPEHALVMREWHAWATERLDRLDPLMSTRAVEEAEGALRPTASPQAFPYGGTDLL